MCVLDDIKRGVSNHDLVLVRSSVYALRLNGIGYIQMGELFSEYGSLDQVDFDELMQEIDHE